VPWLSELTKACHEHGAKVMIQLTHLGRRSSWNTGDWLPVVAPSNVREPAHRAFPKGIEDWDVERILDDYADAAERMQAAGLDGIELQCYGHLIDGFWSPATNRATTAGAGRWITGCASSTWCWMRSATGSGRSSSSASAWWPTRTGTRA